MVTLKIVKVNMNEILVLGWLQLGGSMRFKKKTKQ